MSLKRPTIAPLTRRRFLAAVGATALTVKSHALSGVRAHKSRFAYTASPGEVRVYSTQTTPWTPIQSIPSEAPVSLAIDTRTHTLHVLQEVAEHQDLPRGYIESFRIDSRTGRLAQLHHQPLSLSAIYPRQMALSPDGKTLAVAVQGGSAYNLLPILKDGRPGCPIAIRKETGLSSSSPARPTQIAFNSTSDSIFALDHGAATLSIFSSQPELLLLTRFLLPARSSPQHFALHTSANLLFVTDTGNKSIRTLRLNAEKAEISEAAPPLYSNFHGPLVLHPLSQALVASSGDTLNVFKISPASGILSRSQRMRLPSGYHEPHSLLLAPSEQSLFAATGLGILQFEIDPSTGLLGFPSLAAETSARVISFI